MLSITINYYTNICVCACMCMCMCMRAYVSACIRASAECARMYVYVCVSSWHGSLISVVLEVPDCTPQIEHVSRSAKVLVFSKLSLFVLESHTQLETEYPWLYLCP